MLLSAEDTTIDTLGPATITSPMVGQRQRFLEDARVLALSTTDELARYRDAGAEVPSFEQAGPRRDLYFDPAATTCGIVTCGGLCPGLNDVIRSVVMTLSYGYRVERILGFRYGYAGLASASGLEPMELTPERVEDIHTKGGTLLGSSRGPQEPDDMVATLQRWGVDILFAIGGDGTLRGASVLGRELRRRGLDIAVIGLPKTIDNDLLWVERSFGFATAVEEASRVIAGAHAEARGAWNGVGLVKLMGRHSGFITAHASLANPDVNFCLVPEVPFTLHGEGGFLAHLEARLARRRHAVIAVAEGAAQDLLATGDVARDVSGNVKLHDVGIHLRDEIRRSFAERGLAASVKYIDPSYIIRSLPANALDSEYCLALGQHAVHAGMAGRTEMMVGYWNRHYTHVPLRLATDDRKHLRPTGELWQRVLGATGQPSEMVGRS